jgi:hypothetical protein
MSADGSDFPGRVIYTPPAGFRIASSTPAAWSADGDAIAFAERLRSKTSDGSYEMSIKMLQNETGAGC